MTAALTLMAKDERDRRSASQVLFIPATDASVDTDSYHEFGTGRFLARAFMKYGWDLYVPDEKTRNNPYVSPLRASNKELQGLPPRSSSPRRMIRFATKAKPMPASSRTRVSQVTATVRRNDPRLRAPERHPGPAGGPGGPGPSQ